MWLDTWLENGTGQVYCSGVFNLKGPPSVNTDNKKRAKAINCRKCERKGRNPGKLDKFRNQRHSIKPSTDLIHKLKADREMPGKRAATESLAMLGIVKHAQMNKVPKTQLCLKGFRLQSSNLNDKISLRTCTSSGWVCPRNARMGKYFATLTSRQLR